VARLTATEAARNFSEALNRVAAGEEIEIVRNGATVAVLARPRRRLLSPDAFREVLATAPAVDDRFADDLRELRKDAGMPEAHWQS
jgi:prevent-host-death family protein